MTPGFNVAPMGFNVQPVQHSNEWMQVPGQIGGSIVGSFFFPPFGTMIGGQAGKAAGGLFGDVIGGNWDGALQDVIQTLPPELLSLFGAGGR